MAFDPFADYLGLGELLETSGQQDVVTNWSRYRKSSSDTCSSGDIPEVELTPIGGFLYREGSAGVVSSPRAIEK